MHSDRHTLEQFLNLHVDIVYALFCVLCLFRFSILSVFVLGLVSLILADRSAGSYSLQYPNSYTVEVSVMQHPPAILNEILLKIHS